MGKRWTFLFLCLASISAILMAPPEARAVSVTYNADDINPAYQKVFGRDATPDEVAYWSRNDVRQKFAQTCEGVTNALDHDHCVNWARKRAEYLLMQQMTKYFNTPEGGPELKATIDRSYKAAFNRLPNPEELAYWQTELRKPREKAEHMGYEYLILAHKKWMQTSVKPQERTALIQTAYAEVYGRPPSKNEADFWMADMPKKGVLYSELCNYLKDWISGNSKEQIRDLEDLIRRGYVKASVSSGPNPEEMKLAMNYVTSKRPSFNEFVDWVKREHTMKVHVAPPAATTPVKVPSFKR